MLLTKAPFVRRRPRVPRSLSARASARVLLLIAVALAITSGACSDAGSLSRARLAVAREDAAPPAAATLERVADVRAPPPGVPDRGRSAGLVMLELGHSIRCAAVLVSADVALAPIRCLTKLSGCERSSVSLVSLRTADDAASVVAHVAELVSVDPCDDDAVAAFVLESDAAGFAPFPLRARPAVAGQFVRSVAVLRGSAPRQERVVRDHVRIEDLSGADFSLFGDLCPMLPGGIAVDEGTGELLGVAVSPRDGCPLGVAVFRQADALRPLVALATARADERRRAAADGGAGTVRRPKPTRPTTDLGEPCADGAGCAAGVCVTEANEGYCSRACGPSDRCPTGLRCERLGDVSVCVRSR